MISPVSSLLILEAETEQAWRAADNTNKTNTKMEDIVEEAILQFPDSVEWKLSLV